MMGSVHRLFFRFKNMDKKKSFDLKTALIFVSNLLVIDAKSQNIKAIFYRYLHIFKQNKTREKWLKYSLFAGFCW